MMLRSDAVDATENVPPTDAYSGRAFSTGQPLSYVPESAPLQCQGLKQSAGLKQLTPVGSTVRFAVRVDSAVRGGLAVGLQVGLRVGVE